MITEAAEARSTGLVAAESRTVQAMQARLQELDPNSERYQILLVAKNFKIAWLNLAKSLTEVFDQGLAATWGYPSFENYCARELHLRADTARKLIRSYTFLKSYEPEMLARNTDRYLLAAKRAKSAEREAEFKVEEEEVPPLDVVDMLSQASSRAHIADADLALLRQEIFADKENLPYLTRAKLMKRLRKLDPQAFKASPKTASKETETEEEAADSENLEAARPLDTLNIGKEVSLLDLRKALLLAERLESLLKTEIGASPEVLAGMSEVVEELKARFSEASKTHTPASLNVN